MSNINLPIITATEINTGFSRGFSLSSYRGVRVYSLDTNTEKILPQSPGSISYSDFINKIVPQANYPLPDVIFSSQVQNVSAFIGQGTALFAVTVSANYKLNEWPSTEPNPTGTGISYQWQYSTDGGTTWIDDGTNSRTYSISAILVNNGVRVRVKVTAFVLAPLVEGGSSFPIVSATETSRVATLSVTELVLDNPDVVFTKSLTGSSIVIKTEANGGGGVTVAGNGSMSFGSSSPWYTAYPTVPSWRTPRTNNSVYTWYYRTSSSASQQVLTNGTLTGVTVSADQTITFTNLVNTAYDGYQFRLGVTATTTVSNPGDTLTDTAYSNWATLLVDSVQEQNLATLTSIASNGPVTDRLSTNSAGPTFTLRSVNAVGKTVRFDSTNATGQLVGLVISPAILQPTDLQQDDDFTVTSNQMTFGLAQNKQPGLLRKLRTWAPSTESITVSGSGSDWQNGSQVVGTTYQILNDAFSGSVTGGQSFHEGTPIVNNVIGSDVVNATTTSWTWQLAGFSVGANPAINDVSASSGSFGFSYSGSVTTGNYVGRVQIPTLKNPANPTSGIKETKKTGTLNIFDSQGVLFSSRQITITKYPEDTAVLPTLINGYVDTTSNTNRIATTFFKTGIGTSAAQNRGVPPNIKTFEWAIGGIPEADQDSWRVTFGTPNVNVVTSGTRYQATMVSGFFGIAPFMDLTLNVPLNADRIPLNGSRVEVTGTVVVNITNIANPAVNDSLNLTMRLFLPARNPDGTLK